MKLAGVRQFGLTAWVLVLAVLVPEVAEGQQNLINRREEARAAFQATSQGVYDHYCAHCHGDDGTGSGRLWASELSPRPADLTALDADREYLITAIRDGSASHGKSNLCPPWGRTISPTDIERLAHYITALGSGTSAAPVSEADALPQPVGEPFPWLLSGVVLAELVLLWQMFRRKKEVSHAVSQDPAVRG